MLIKDAIIGLTSIFLLAISAFIRFAYAVPLRSKRVVEVARALESIFEKD